MSSVKQFHDIFKDKKVFITGHTGFIGTWLSFWLHLLGAKIIGYSLPPPTNPSLFETINLKEKIIDITGDVRDGRHLQDSLLEHKPEFIFHLAAQPLVLASYRDPVDTITTNVMGSVNILESVRQTPSVKICINFTSDKCYDNHESDYAYSETDALGGFDPYSASKGASELLTSSYRNSFFKNDSYDNHKANISTVRAGNVIGGGDWAENRIIPDCVRSLTRGTKIPIRHPYTIRPWQYVLEPISGMLWLATKMWESPNYDEAWNFGPDDSDTTVRNLLNNIIAEWGDGTWEDLSKKGNDFPYEAKLLRLNCTKAKKALGWFPVYTISEAIVETISWYKAYYGNQESIVSFTKNQINRYVNKAKQMNSAWAS